MNEDNIGQYLNQVIECLVDREKSYNSGKKQNDSIANLYQNTNELLGQFQDRVSQCKKYNQAKIHRKYEIIINDLEKQNRDLKLKIDFQLQARPSSQIYVSDLIDKMINLQNQNQSLERQNQSLNSLIANYEQKYQMVMTNTKQEQEENPQAKELLKKQWEKMLIKDTVQQFLIKKSEEQSLHKRPQKTIFEKFLQFNKSKLHKWHLSDFFDRLDKWTVHLKDMRHLDKLKIRNEFEGSISNVTDADTPFVFRTAKQYKTLEKGLTAPNSIHLTPLAKNRGMPRQQRSAKNTSFRFKSLYQSQKRIDPLASE